MSFMIIIGTLRSMKLKSLKLTRPSSAQTRAAGPQTGTAGPPTRAAGPPTRAAGPPTRAAGPQTHAAGPQTHAARPQTHAVSPLTRAFSMMEVLIVVAVLGIIAAAAFAAVTRVNTGARVTKLESDVSTVNQAIKVYIANGGHFGELAEPQAIIDKLKTERSDAAAGTFAGLRGTMIDKRLRARLQNSGETSSNALRAIWSTAKLRFELADSGAGGVAEFVFDESLSTVNFGSEERDLAAIDLNPNSGWIWAYEDTPSLPPPGPTYIPVSGAPPPGSVPPGGGGPGGPQQLLAPSISPGGGAFNYAEFPLAVLISNPNPGLSSWVMVSTGGGYSKYTGPLTVAPDTVVSAYATGDPVLWTDSTTVSGTYSREDYQLLPPNIVASSSQFDSANPTVTVTLTNPNPAAISKLVYRLTGQVSTQDYTGPITLAAADYPDGVTVYGQALGLETFALDSGEAARTIANAEPVKLTAPTIALSSSQFNDTTSTITVTLTDPNPAGSSQLYYALKAPAAGYPAVSGYLPYTGTFPVTVGAFPDGFHIQTYAKSLDTSNYTDSDFAEAVTGAAFFDIALTGDVLFILDASGSMNASHGTSTRFATVIQELIKAINQLSETQKFSVVLFSSGIRWTDGSYRLKDATPSNKEKMIGDLLAQTARGGTNYGVALAQALEFDVYPEQVLFLSDGLPNQNNYLDEVATLSSLGIVVDTIGIGNINSQAPLQNIANLTSGTYTFISKPGSGGKHRSPTFSVDSGSFDYTAFPIVVSLTNPNATTDPQSFIRYSVNGGAVNTYAGPLSLGYNMKVEAFVDTTDPIWAKSDPASKGYSVLDYYLTKPGMTLSSDTVGGSTGNSITVTLTDPNPAGLANLVYWFEGETEANSAQPYTGPFTIVAESNKWGKSKEIKLPVARAVGTQSFVVNSPITSESISVASGGSTTPLDPVKFAPDGNRFDYTKFPLTVNLYNGNAVSSSYIMVSINGGDYAAYTAPLSVGYNTTVKAYVNSSSSSWSKSEERTMFYEVKTIQLSEPSIGLSTNVFKTRDSQITMTITNPNSTAISRVIWWFEGQDEATTATVYTGPVTLVASAWEAYNPAGGDEVKILTRAQGTQSFASNSKTKDKKIENDN